MFHFQSPDVLRFLAGKQPNCDFTGEVTSSFRP
jgi:hypothetical protein